MSVAGNDKRTLIDEVATLDNLADLRSHVLSLAARAGLRDGRAEAFALAVNEAVANAIRHAGGSGEFALVQDDERRLIAEVRDHGPGIPCSVTVTMPPPDAESGRGMPLVEELADHAEIDSDHRGARVRLEMSLRS